MKFVLVTFDCLPVTALSCYGNPWARTPTFDRLACVATLFENHFTPLVPKAAAQPDPAGDILADAGVRVLGLAGLVRRLRDRGVCIEVVTDRPLPPDVAQSRDDVQTIDAPIGWDVAVADSRPGRLFEAAKRAIERLQERNSGLLWVRSSGVDGAPPSRESAAKLQAHLDAYRQQTVEAILADRRRPRREGEQESPPDDTEAAVAAAFVDRPSLFLRFGSRDTATFHDWADGSQRNPAGDAGVEAVGAGQHDRSDASRTEDGPAPLLEHWLFDACVTQLDEAFAPFLTACQSVLGKDALLLVAGLFGRERGERAWVNHLRSLRGAAPQPAALVHEELIHVPLWAAGASFRPAERVHELTQSEDIAATVLAHMCHRPDSVTATTLLKRPSDRRLVLRGEDGSMAVRTPDHLLLMAPAPLRDANMGGSAAGSDGTAPAQAGSEGSVDRREPQLFLKPEDRWEINDVSKTHVDVCEELSRHIDGIRDAFRS